MKPLLFSLSAPPGLEKSLCNRLGLQPGEWRHRRFPDGESYVRLVTPVEGRDVLFLCSLADPDPKALTLLFAADAARAQNARRIGLVAPYLPYMRQDKAFQPGEAITSRTFARLVSDGFDWLVTVDPHLHRFSSLDAIYSIPAIAATACRPIASWISDHVAQPILIGPDEESEQWVGQIANLIDAPVSILSKQRSGDHDVRIDGKGLDLAEGQTPVIVDDIMSSARTTIETVRVLTAAGARDPVCIAVHGLFAGDAYSQLVEAGPARIVTTNSVDHPTNAIDISAEVAEAVRQAMEQSVQL